MLLKGCGVLQLSMCEEWDFPMKLTAQFSIFQEDELNLT